jgi:hypothetical protein
MSDEHGFVWSVDGGVNFDKQWHLQCEKLVYFQRKNGHCTVPQGYEQDKALANWVDMWRTCHKQSKLRQDRKEILDELGFVWSVDSAGNYDKQRNNDDCAVPQGYEEDKATKNETRRDRKELRAMTVAMSPFG